MWIDQPSGELAKRLAQVGLTKQQLDALRDQLQPFLESDQTVVASSRPLPSLTDAHPTVEFHPAATPSPAESLDTQVFTSNSMAGPRADAGAGPSDLVGNYRLEEAIGKGGMGIVYRATHLKLDRTVALKLIRDNAQASADNLVRFEREARSAARLSHKNIVTVFEYGQQNDVPYIAMEYVAGESLAEKLKRDGPLSDKQAANWLRQIAVAIGYAHDNGIIHRDLKPANILIDNFGTPKVADFGLARAERDDIMLTATGVAVGTPSYMSPEQASAKGDEVGKPTDIYSLGAILYECLTGLPPFRGENKHLILMQVIDEPVVPPRVHNAKIGRDAEAICLKCLAKLPEKRYKNAYEFIADIDRLLDDQSVQARSHSMSERVQYFVREHIAILATVAVLLLTLPIFFVVMLSDYSSSSSNVNHTVAINLLSEQLHQDGAHADLWSSRGEHHYELGIWLRPQVTRKSHYSWWRQQSSRADAGWQVFSTPRQIS